MPVKTIHGALPQLRDIFNVRSVSSDLSSFSVWSTPDWFRHVEPVENARALLAVRPYARRN